MVKAFKVDVLGNQVEVNLAEYAQELNSRHIAPACGAEMPIVESCRSIVNTAVSPSVLVTPIHTHRFEETRTYRSTGNPVKVTPDVVGPGVITYGTATTIGTSFSSNITVSGERSAIVSGVSFTWENSLQTQTSFGINYNIPNGKIGYIQFKPYFNVSVGNLTDTVWMDGTPVSQSSKGVWGKSPVLLGSGIADGIYELILRNS